MLSVRVRYKRLVIKPKEETVQILSQVGCHHSIGGRAPVAGQVCKLLHTEVLPLAEKLFFIFSLSDVFARLISFVGLFLACLFRAWSPLCLIVGLTQPPPM
ncbi:hypothetical protein ILYODFUR_034510 [Ilyodon furcidens]|uniref:Uncharacterized protein n=1 Tax=Ilyodon furcidens TaxID=33524 RepID=A0ABV0T2T1_9TELE